MLQLCYKCNIASSFVTIIRQGYLPRRKKPDRPCQARPASRGKFVPDAITGLVIFVSNFCAHCVVVQKTVRSTLPGAGGGKHRGKKCKAIDKIR
jgi:hypothetical protein